MIFRVSASILLLMLLPGRAQTPVEGARPATISDDRMRSILRGMEFDFTEDSTGGSTTFTFHLEGILVTLLNQIKGLSLSSCFDGDVDLMKGNQWNREHFSTRTSINDKGCFSLRSDLSFGGGLSNQMIQDFVRQFCTDVAVFARFLVDSPARTQSLDRLASPIGAMAWSQIGPYTKRMPPSPRSTGSVPGLLKIDSKVSWKYDPDQWRPAASDVDGQVPFTHASGGSHALVISEPIAVPLASVEDVALANAQSVDPRARVIFRNRNWVKGVASSFLKIEATVGTIPMVYWGYFYVGEGGTVQVFTYTEKSQLPKYELGFMDFLNGLTVSK